MYAFLGTLKLNAENMAALEGLRLGGIPIRFVSFYARRDVLYVYLETDRPIESEKLREALGGPSFFMDAHAKQLYWEHWERRLRERGIRHVERGRKRFEIQI